MYEFRALLNQFWVTRREDKELYFNLKRTLPDYRRLVNELLGWNLVVNELVVKLEKTPAQSHALDGHPVLSGTAGLLPSVRPFAIFRRTWMTALPFCSLP